ncbi:PAS domain S-box protein [Litoribacter alkaliphilus]|uniref:histidine kinase n=1 Tax=Litoribacter ruber TaxID=702568 RepID=A0AAP2CIX9_9BACT|nr:PAS domain S-box protein [Litoribacter alkaliphilus]MBS9524544.1 PAS domain S-box protein [Litoribacter alkaliphilus]
MLQAYRKVFKDSVVPSAIFDVDAPTFTILDVNKAYTEVVKSSFEKIVGKGVFEAFPDLGEGENHGQSDLLAALKETIATKDVFKMPVIKYDVINQQTGKREEKYWELSSSPMLDSSGKVESLLIQINDITPHLRTLMGGGNIGMGKKSTSLFEEIDFKFKNIFDFSSAGIALLDLEGHWMEVNPKIPKMFGYSRWELLKMNFQKMTHPGDLDHCLELLDDLVEGKKDSFETEKRYYHRNGKVIWVVSSLTIVRKPNGEPNYFVAHFLDITEKKQIELALQESEQRHQSLVTHNPDAVYSFDLEGRFISANVSTYKLVEKTAEELIGSLFLPFIQFDDKRRVYENFLKASAGDSITYSCGVMTSTGKEKFIQVTNMPIISQDKIVGVHGIAKDITDKVLAEKQLLASKDQYEQLISTVDGIVWESDDNLKFHFVSPQTSHILGYDPNDWYANENFLMDHLHPEDKMRIWKEFLVGMEKGSNFSFEFRMINADGNTVWLRTNVAVIRQRKRTLLRGVLSDISEAREAIIALQANEAKLSKIMDSAVDVICTIDAEGTFVDLNPAAEQMWGYKPEEMKGRKIYEFILEEDLPKTYHEAEAIVNGKNIKTFENRYHHKNGHLVNNIWSASFDRQTGLMYCVARDISEKKAVEYQLQQSEQRFKNLVQNGADIVGIMDEEGVFKYVSPNTESITGFKSEEIVGKNGFEFVHPDDLEKISNKEEELANTNKVALPPHRFRCKDGSFIWIDSVITNHLSDPAINGLVFNSRDISFKIEADQELKKSEERHKLLFQLSPVPQFVYDSESLEILDVNQKAVDFYGYSYEEFTTLTIKDIRPKSDLPKLQASLEKMKGKQFKDFGIFTHQKKDGTLVKMEISGYEMDFHGNSSVMTVAVDVTEREKALDEIKNQKAKLIKAQEMAKMGYWQIDLKDNSLYWSEETYKIWEQEAENVSNVDWFYTTIYPQDVHIIQNSFTHSLETGSELDIEFRIQLKDGRIKWIHELGKMVLDEQGKQVYFEGTVQDITERKLVQAKLEESNQRYELLTQATSEAIFDWDMVNGDIYYGQGFEKMFGYDINELGQSRKEWIKFIHPNDKNDLDSSLDEFLEGTAQTWEHNCRLINAQGVKYYVNLYAIVVRSEEGIPLRLVGTIHDITLNEQQEKEKQLKFELGRSFALNDSPQLSMAGCLDSLLRYTEMIYGEVWVPAIAGQNQLTLLTHKGKLKVDPNRYPTLMDLDQGMQGAVWNQDQVSLLNELSNNDVYYRKEFAKLNKLETAVAFPLNSVGQSLAMVILYSKEKITDLNNLNYISSATLEQIASDFRRKTVENELNLFFDLSKDILAITGYDGYVKKVNNAIQSILGYTPQELLSIPFETLIHQEDVDRTKNFIEETRKNQSLAHFENRYIHKNGHEVWMAWTVSPYVQENVLFCVARDITENKLKEQELRESSERIFNILDSIKDGFYALDRNFKVTYFNDEAERLLQRKKEDVIGQSLWKEFPEAESPELKFYTNYKKVMDTQEPITFMEYFEPLEGWFDITAYPSEEGVSVYFKNVTDKILKDEEIEKANSRVNKILESIQDAFFAIEEDWTVTYWNKEAERLLGIGRENVEGRNLWEVFPEATKRQFYPKYKEALQDRKVVTVIDYYPPSDKWFEVTAYPAESGLSIYFKDYTEKKKMEVELEKFRKAYQGNPEDFAVVDVNNN